MEVGRHFPSVSPFRSDSIPSVAYRQMHSFLGSICLTASECFPIFIYSFALAELPVCDSTRAVREFSFSGRMNDLEAAAAGFRGCCETPPALSSPLTILLMVRFCSSALTCPDNYCSSALFVRSHLPINALQVNKNVPFYYSVTAS